ncbi:MAG: MCP four helix bundle domain-containing protein, partial [Minwuiales bacterium]|nr:MCP four helix bundle domain-containing protein [Minwuiales bacterium]
MSVNSSKAANASGKRGSLGVGIKGKSGGLSFANLNVGVKVGAGFALILVFLLAVSIVSSMGLSGANGNFGEYRQIARQSNQLGRIQANLLTARLGVKDYIITGTDKAAETVEKRIATLATLIEDAKELFTSEEKVRQITHAQGEMAEYKAAFEKTIEFRAQRNGFVDTMNEVGPKSERALTKIMKSAFEDGDAQASFLAGQTLRHLLLARLYSNRFLVDNAQA